SGMTTPEMDDFDYSYNTNSNQLIELNDPLVTSAFGDDIEGQYHYDYYANGNLDEDITGGIYRVYWTPSGKIKEIRKTDGSKLEFVYDATGNRIAKIFYPLVCTSCPSGFERTITVDFYSRDAQGNTMANYKISPLEGTTLF